MDPSKFGDSYDIVKQAMLRWLIPLGTWAAHPMFAKDYRRSHPMFAAEFRRFLGVPVLTEDPIPDKPQRAVYFDKSLCAFTQDHLFVDPDIGLAMPDSKLTKKHLAAQELCRIAHGRPCKLTLVYDQSFSHMSEKARRRKTNCKQAWLQQHGLYSITYFSHTNFLLTSTDEQIISVAKRTLSARLPANRLVSL